jgi:cobalt-zinc-cadmium efflux system outer membrane protein
MGTVTDQGWQPMRPLGNDLPTYRPPLDPKAATPPASLEEPQGEITLRQSLALALLHNPALANAAWEVRMAEARRLQAGLPPNPEIGFDIETLGALRAAESVLQFGQLILLGGKLKRQQKVAALDRDLAGWDYEARRIAVMSETTKAFVTLVAAQERLAVAGELVTLSEKMRDTASERVRTGKAAPLEEMKAKVELSTVRIQREQARQEVESARRQLATMWGSTSVTFTRAAGRLEPAPGIPVAEDLSALLQQNPDVARWATEMQQRQAVARLERARAIPDLTLGGGYKRDGAAEGDRNGWAFGLSIPVPIFDRNQGGIAESRYGLSKAEHQRRAAQADAYRDLAEAYQSLATAFATSGILHKEVLPEAQKAFDASTAGYQEGKFAYLDVLDAQRTLFEARLQYIESLAEYYRAAANVEGLIGQSLDSVTKKDQED